MLSLLLSVFVVLLSIGGSEALLVTEAPLVTEIVPDVPYLLKAISSVLPLPPVGLVYWTTTTYPCPTKTTYTRPGDGEPCTYDPGYSSCTAPASATTYPGPGTLTTCPSPATVTVTVPTIAPTTSPSLPPTTSSTTSPTTSSPSTGPTFSCPEAGYNIPHEGTNVIQAIDPITGISTDLNIQSESTTNLNTFGYNVLDNTFYAIDYNTDPYTIVHIFADGTLETVGPLDPADRFNMGDCDTNGSYWISRFGETWIQYDVRPGSPTKGMSIAQGTSTAPELGRPNDWAFVPDASNAAGGTFFSMITASDGTAGISQWDPATKVWTTFQRYPTVSVATWGWAFTAVGNATSPPRIIAADNDSGLIYTFPLDSSGNFTTGPIGPLQGSNDAARCVLNSIA